MSFLDLKNAFGSVSHLLIRDMLHHIKLPKPIIAYIINGYSQLSAFVKTKFWSTRTFQIQRGVFQGDTLSLLIFLITFNPLLELCHKLPTCGFQLKLPLPNSCGLPPTDAAIYVEWNEPDSDEPPGWYYAIVKQYRNDSKALIEYADFCTEVIDLHSINWFLTRKGQKRYLPLENPPCRFPLKKLRAECEKPKFYHSTAHTVKGYADDISILSSNLQDHKSCLEEFSLRAADLDFILNPENVPLLYLTEQKSIRSPPFQFIPAIPRTLPHHRGRF